MDESHAWHTDRDHVQHYHKQVAHPVGKAQDVLNNCPSCNMTPTMACLRGDLADLIGAWRTIDKILMALGDGTPGEAWRSCVITF